MTPCPFCHVSGMIRVEHVIAHRYSHAEYHCSSCHHTWWKEPDGRISNPVVSPQEFTAKERKQF